MTSPDVVEDVGPRKASALGRAISLAEARRDHLLLTSSVVVAGAVLVGRIDQGWWHHDDGSLAQSAERVLDGELPHRDFAELYTGLLSFLNAGVFALFGEDMFNLRLPLFVAFLGFVAAFYAVARRIVSSLWAFVTTLAAIGWSVPVYPAPMPSWYLLFLSTLTIYAIVRFFESGRRSWLVGAGVCAGLAVAIKIVGVWFVIAALLALVVAPLLERPHESPKRTVRQFYGTLVTVAALASFAAVVMLMSARPRAGEIVGLALPVAVACAAVGAVGWRTRSDRTLLTDTVPARETLLFLTGVSIPLILLLTPYALTWSIADLAEGVFVAPRSRFEFASYDMPEPTTLLWGCAVLLVFLMRPRLSERLRLLVDVVVSSVIVFLVATATSIASYTILWNTSRALAPLALIVGAVAIARARAQPASIDARIVSLLVLAAGFSALLQFPFAAPVYFCYVAPLALLAAIASFKYVGLGSGLLSGVILLAIATFGIRQLDTQSIWSLGKQYSADGQIVTLDSERASIRVRPEVEHRYARVRRLVTQHRGREPIFAGPDAPEIYFLTRSRNPTRVVLDFLDRSGSTRGDRLIQLLRDERVRVVVLNLAPEQSAPLDHGTVQRIRSEYPSRERIDNFEIRWK